MKNYELVLVALAVVAVVSAGAFVYAYNSYSNEVSIANQLSIDKQSLQVQLTAALANVTSLTQYRAQLQLRVQQDEANITSLKATITKLDANVTSTTNQKTQLEAQVSLLNSQLSQLTSQISSLNSQISALNSQVSSLANSLNLGNKTSLAANKVFTIGPEYVQCAKGSCYTINNNTLFFTFNPKYAGLVIIWGTSENTTNVNNGNQYAIIAVSQAYSTVPEKAGCFFPNVCPAGQYVFGNPETGTYIEFAVVPGTVDFWLSNYSNSPITITYSIDYYS
jgi:predicted  nucleic acid-binding Zn-ribbon protein